MSENESFEPYVDWDGLTEEMSADFHEIYVSYREAAQKFLKSGVREDAVELLRLQADLGGLNEAITRTLIVIPAMVHVAAPVKSEPCEDHDDHDDHTVQRCSRCGSVLQFWREGLAILTPGGPHVIPEEEIKWWPEGATIAKATDDDGPSTMYQIEDRALERYEMLCVDLASQFPSSSS